MFLLKLNKNEKKAFLQLAHYVARVDGNFGDEEKVVMQTYAYEMGIEDEGFKENEFNLDRTLESFETDEAKKIVLIEIMALIYADNKVDEKEEEIIENICKKFTITRKKTMLYEEWTKAMLALYKQGELFLSV
ncbi:MAG: TerB family tellurite resistance protein [Hydrogenimonas sp.]|nr:MAG: TerB family tellurite resistance protein [Hydrogenimonas sp.]